MSINTKIKKPDIAFWFDEEDVTLDMVKVKNGMPQIQLIQASFDLLSKALKTDDDTTILSFEREEGVNND